MSRWQKQDCPSCGCNDYTLTEDNGFGFCFQCGYKEQDNQTEVKKPERSKYKKEIRAFYTEVTEYFHRCLYDNYEALKYLYFRGITDDTIEELKLGFIPRGNHPLCKLPECLEAGLTKDGVSWMLGNRVSFPFFVTEDKVKQVCDIWGRSIDPSCNPKYRYLAPNHSAYQRWADYPYLVDTGHRDQTVVITEGIIKPILPYQEGMSTIGFPGTLSRRKFTPYQKQKVVICFDNQVKNRRQLVAAIKKQAERYSNPYVATLPLRGKEKQDIDSYIQDYGISEYRKIIDNALPYREWKHLA